MRLGTADRGRQPSATFDHFAYGSNLCSERLGARCPSAHPVAVGFVRYRQLRFHKIGIDGTGKANAYWTGSADNCIWGVIYRCWLSEKQILDACESLGTGYDAVPVTVHVGSRCVETYLYEARPECIDPNLKPLAWYHSHCLRGARQHSLPLEYQQTIESFL